MSTEATAPVPSRHDLLRLSPLGWREFERRRPDLASLDGVRLWIDRGWPVMSRRRQPDDAPDLLPLALALPPAFGRLRLGFTLPADAIASTIAPITLDRAIAQDGVPADWGARLDEVRIVASGLDLTPRLFGSLMWQIVTGLAYLRPGSDLDLLWTVPHAAAAGCLLQALTTLDQSPGPRLDGEIVVPGLGAVSWRELATGPDTVLLKTETDVRLVERARLLPAEPPSPMTGVQRLASGGSKGQRPLPSLTTAPPTPC